MFQLELSEKTYSVKDILQHNSSVGLSEYESQVFNFCKTWLSKEKSAFTLNTSGSTGKPKEIKLSRDQMSLSAQMTKNALDLKENDRSLVCLNASFIAGQMMLVRGMETGMKVKVIEPSSNPFFKLSPDEKFDFTAMVPMQVETILKESPEKKGIFNRMKAIIIGGAPVSISLEEKLELITAPVYLTFGMTETVSHIALRKLNGKDKSDRFKALDNVFISQDERGCLVIDSPLTAEPVITNDLVELRGEKEFLWKGRIDNVINSGGIKIHPEIVERKLEEIFKNLPVPLNYFIDGLPDEKLGKKVCLFIEDSNLQRDDKNYILTLIKSKVTGYESPKECFFLEKFILTPTGKINKVETTKKFKSYL